MTQGQGHSGRLVCHVPRVVVVELDLECLHGRAEGVAALGRVGGLRRVRGLRGVGLGGGRGRGGGGVGRGIAGRGLHLCLLLLLLSWGLRLLQVSSQRRRGRGREGEEHEQGGQADRAEGRATGAHACRKLEGLHKAQTEGIGEGA